MDSALEGLEILPEKSLLLERQNADEALPGVTLACIVADEHETKKKDANRQYYHDQNDFNGVRREIENEHATLRAVTLLNNENDNQDIHGHSLQVHNQIEELAAVIQGEDQQFSTLYIKCSGLEERVNEKDELINKLKGELAAAEKANRNLYEALKRHESWNDKHDQVLRYNATLEGELKEVKITASALQSEVQSLRKKLEQSKSSVEQAMEMEMDLMRSQLQEARRQLLQRGVGDEAGVKTQQAMDICAELEQGTSVTSLEEVQQKTEALELEITQSPALECIITIADTEEQTEETGMNIDSAIVSSDPVSANLQEACNSTAQDLALQGETLHRQRLAVEQEELSMHSDGSEKEDSDDESSEENSQVDEVTTTVESVEIEEVARPLTRSCLRQTIGDEYCQDIDTSSRKGTGKKNRKGGKKRTTERSISLDRAFLTEECGFVIHSALEDTSMTSNAIKIVVSSKSRTSVSGSNTEKGGVPQFRLQPFVIRDLIFEKYKANTLRKQDEAIARQRIEEQEREQERIERAAARKAREAKLEANPWFADGEDFTRKSSRLSGTARPSYNIYSIDTSMEEVGPLKRSYNEAMQLPSVYTAHTRREEPPVVLVSADNNESAENNEESQPSPKKAARSTPKPSKKSIREEAEFREYIESTEAQPRLLSDIDREAWIGTVVMYLITLQVGRVAEYRSGWAVVRTVQGSINCRPYQLEVVEAGSQALATFEDSEMWALCDEDRDESEQDDLPVPIPPPPPIPGTVRGNMLDSFEFIDAENIFEEVPDVVTDAVGLDEHDLMYNAFLNDDEYEAFLLESANPEEHSQNAQQLTHNRSKLLEAASISEEEKRKRLQALTKKREKAQLLLRGQKAGVSSAPVRAISIKRASEDYEVAEPVSSDRGLTKPTHAQSRPKHSSAISPPQQKPLEVMKLGAAPPPLVTPFYRRDTGNTYRRPNVDPPRRLSWDGPPQRRENNQRASLPRPGESRQDAFGRDRHLLNDRQTGESSKQIDVNQRVEVRTENEAAHSNARDPLIKIHTEREHNTHETLHSRAAPESVPVIAVAANRTRESDYRSMKNASADVRTAKANIDYLQAEFVADQDRGSSSNNTESRAMPAKKVNFGGASNAISGSIIDYDVLNITGDNDTGYFSPVSADEEDRRHAGRPNTPPKARTSRFSENFERNMSQPGGDSVPHRSRFDSTISHPHNNPYMPPRVASRPEQRSLKRSSENEDAVSVHENNVSQSKRARRWDVAPAVGSAASAPSAKANNNIFLYGTQTSSSVSSRASSQYPIDRAYPQFNHRHKEQRAVAHIEQVMPESMHNLTTVLKDNTFVPPMGFPQQAPRKIKLHPAGYTSSEPQPRGHSAFAAHSLPRGRNEHTFHQTPLESNRFPHNSERDESRFESEWQYGNHNIQHRRRSRSGSPRENRHRNSRSHYETPRADDYYGQNGQNSSFDARVYGRNPPDNSRDRNTGSFH